MSESEERPYAVLADVEQLPGSDASALPVDQDDPLAAAGPLRETPADLHASADVHVPDENPTGDHRLVFELPDWSYERLLLRFDGVESIYRVWLNGIEVGVGKGSRLVQEFDISDVVRSGRNVIFVRVHQWSSMSYLEDQDQWWLPGIFRDVTVLSRPYGSVDDLWLRTEYALDGEGVIDPKIIAVEHAFPIEIAIPELDVRQRFENPNDVAPFPIGQVEPCIPGKIGLSLVPSPYG